MAAYYNENDPFAAAWLRNLIAAGHIADGDVDERDTRDVLPADLAGYVQCHFFAGVGVWSYALRLAGWPDDRPVWTGSCPCQPFSAAGRSGGFADERHLWPHWFHLISQCRPVRCLGEQVASGDGLAWLDLVQADLEGAGYTTSAVDLCAAGVGAPHIRQRLYWVADASCERHERGRETRRRGTGPTNGGGAVRLADAHDPRPQGRSERRNGTDERPVGAGGLGSHGVPGPTNGYWRDADWLFCRDGRWRPARPGAFPLAHGSTARVGRLRAYGNAIVPQAAAEFIASYVDALENNPRLTEAPQGAGQPANVSHRLGHQPGELD